MLDLLLLNEQKVKPHQVKLLSYIPQKVYKLLAE
jgi:hypothetical protein